MSQPTGYTARDFVPLLPCVGGGILSAWRFSAHDALGGLVFGLAGVLVMIGLGVLSRNDP